MCINWRSSAWSISCRVARGSVEGILPGRDVWIYLAERLGVEQSCAARSWDELPSEISRRAVRRFRIGGGGEPQRVECVRGDRDRAWPWDSGRGVARSALDVPQREAAHGRQGRACWDSG